MTVLSGLADGRLKDLTPLKQGPLARALEALDGGGEETRLVGGAVRDLALGEPAFAARGRPGSRSRSPASPTAR